MTTLLVDADGIAYEAASAVQRTVLWEDDMATVHADLREAQDAFAASVEGLKEAAAATDVVLCFSLRPYFRSAILPTYKANRKGTPPLVLKDLRRWASAEYPTKVKPGLEADDVVGILATHPTLVKGERIIVSVDKDLDQIPGLRIDPRQPGEVYRIAPEYAERQLWLQVLTGDATDNYTGIPGVGPVKANAILDKAKPEPAAGTLVFPYADVVEAAYLKAGLTAADMAVQVNVARVLTAQTYDFKRKEPILWSM